MRHLFIVIIIVALSGIGLNKVYAALVSNGNNAKNPISILSSKETDRLNVKYVLRAPHNNNEKYLISRENTEFNGTFIAQRESDKSTGALTSKIKKFDLEMLRIFSKEKISSVEEYAEWLKESIEYKNDPDEDVWSMPEETLVKKYGDCEDLAFFNAFVLQMFGYKAKVLALIDGFIVNSHAVCAFQKEGRFYLFDNTDLKETQVSSMKSLIEYIDKRSTFYEIYEIHLNDKDKNVLSRSKY